MYGKVWDRSQCSKVGLSSLRLIRVAMTVVNKCCEIVNLPYLMLGKQLIRQLPQMQPAKGRMLEGTVVEIKAVYVNVCLNR